MLGMAITAMVMSGIVGLIYHEVTTTATTKNIVSAAHEITNAARRFSQDAMMTESTDLVEGVQPVNHVVLSWVERYDFTDIPHSSSYYLEGTDLRRDYDGIITTVARDISTIEFSQSGSIITVSISCTPRWLSANPTTEKTYRIYLRVAEEG